MEKALCVCVYVTKCQQVHDPRVIAVHAELASKQRYFSSGISKNSKLARKTDRKSLQLNINNVHFK